ncbi:MAG: phosphatidate cytidylyltransferase [Nitrospirota bacterium]
MREHAGRVITALVALPLVYGAVVWLPAWAFAVLIGVVVVVAQVELYAMVLPLADRSTWRSGRLPVFALGVLGGVALTAIVASQGARATALPIAATGLVAGLAVTALASGRDLRVATTDAAFALFGVWYVAWLLGQIVLLRGAPRGEWLVLFALWVTWLADAAAFYVGRLWGRRPLAPRVSPRKTVEGAVAALVGGVSAAVLGAAWFVPDFSPGEAAVLGALMAAAGMAGDLVESLIKRGAGVKDSGGLIPSHGGLLDKIDGLLFTAPLIYHYVVWAKGYGGAGASP